MDTVSLYQQLPNNTHYVVSTKIKRGDEIALRILIHKFLPKTNNKKKIFAIISLTYFFIFLTLSTNMNNFLKSITKNT